MTAKGLNAAAAMLNGSRVRQCLQRRLFSGCAPRLHTTTTTTTTDNGATADGPLSGIRVLDMTRILAGPYCTMLLGDLGADIIKIEHPTRGDDTRTWGPPFKNYERKVSGDASTDSTTSASGPLYKAPPEFPGESAYYLCVNRNKRSVAVDMKAARGREIIIELAKRADILVENFVPGKLAEYGLG
ncbi:hypothetical protein LPJ81_001938, partial [Coemansia sp. IMI 209127]